MWYRHHIGMIVLSHELRVGIECDCTRNTPALERRQMSATELRADQKRRVHNLIESHRQDIEGFLAEYVRRRSIDPRRELVDVEAGGTNECQEWLFSRLVELGRVS